jgi:diadenosine tetraphosphatase ApaH/serine/threonine PP2A family protein phosphatase
MDLSGDDYLLINPGSVGQPRDGDPRAAYVIYDSARRVAEFYRAPYDIASAQRKIMEANLPPLLARRLAAGL